jgi:hypothetical protein
VPPAKRTLPVINVSNLIIYLDSHLGSVDWAAREREDAVCFPDFPIPGMITLFFHFKKVSISSWTAN